MFGGLGKIVGLLGKPDGIKNLIAENAPGLIQTLIDHLKGLQPIEENEYMFNPEFFLVEGKIFIMLRIYNTDNESRTGTVIPFDELLNNLPSDLGKMLG